MSHAFGRAVRASAFEALSTARNISTRLVPENRRLQYEHHASHIGRCGGPRAGEWLVERAVREEFEDAQVMMLHGASHIFMHYPNEIQRIARFRKALRDLAESGSDRVFAAAAKLLSRIASRHTK